ncbi:hypothetical protein MNBD_GAMMA24-1684 [hydrothermal vent metagenome]|uniref:Uncharacterized protein n=1 Tax=hydrothermal vent metagenome TaxID=652676 RepID=A0A3B1B372_9ZZZZ
MNLVVKPHRPWLTRMLLGLGIIALIVGGWTLFDYGRYLAGYNRAECADERQTLLAVRKKLEQDVDSLREQKALLERAAQIKREAYAELDTTLKELQGEILELKEELAFYRGIVSPQDASSGLHLQRFKIEPNGESRHYRYKLVLTQVLKNDRLAMGKVRLSIDGMIHQQMRTLKLKELSEKRANELDYRFKYFQKLEGNLKLPQGFTPFRIKVQIIPRNRKRNSIEKTINWSGQEIENHVRNEKETQTDGAN